MPIILFPLFPSPPQNQFPPPPTISISPFHIPLYKCNNLIPIWTQGFRGSPPTPQMLKLFTEEPISQFSKSKSQEFVPFVHERDRMNRLLTSLSPPSLKPLPNEYPSLSSRFLTPENPRTSSVQDSRINRIVSSFFKKVNLESRELCRPKNNNRKQLFFYPEK
jgi:hypothetical protein